MKIFRENPILLIWLVAISVFLGISFFRVKINVNLHSSKDADVSIHTERRAYPQGVFE